LKEKAPNVKVVAQQKAGIGDEGNVQAENFLQANPNIQIICGINDTGCLGAYEVFTAEDHIGDNIGLFGADGDEKALQLIKEGTIYRGTVVSGAFDVFPSAVDMCVEASKGNPPSKEEANIVYPCPAVNIDNVDEYITE
jgi:ABC-type sugar transport system substrate-binding protein